MPKPGKHRYFEEEQGIDVIDVIEDEIFVFGYGVIETTCILWLNQWGDLSRNIVGISHEIDSIDWETPQLRSWKPW